MKRNIIPLLISPQLLVADGIFCAARIGSECAIRSYFPALDERTQLIIEFTVPLALQLGVYFSISKMRQTSYKVWLKTIGVNGLAYGVDLVLSFKKGKLIAEIRNLETQIKSPVQLSGIADNQFDKKAIEKEISDKKNEWKDLWTFQLMVNMALYGAIVTKELKTRSPSFLGAPQVVPTIGYALTMGVIIQQKVTHDWKFLAAPILSFGLSKALYQQLPDRWFDIKRPFPWKIMIVNQSIFAIAGWLLRSQSSPLYTPPAKQK